MPDCDKPGANARPWVFRYMETAILLFADLGWILCNYLSNTHFTLAVTTGMSSQVISVSQLNRNGLSKYLPFINDTQKAPSCFLQKVFCSSFLYVTVCIRTNHFAFSIQGKLCWTRRWQSAMCTRHLHSAASRQLTTYCRVRWQNWLDAFAAVKMSSSNFHEVSDTGN